MRVDRFSIPAATVILIFPFTDLLRQDDRDGGGERGTPISSFLQISVPTSGDLPIKDASINGRILDVRTQVDKSAAGNNPDIILLAVRVLIVDLVSRHDYIRARCQGIGS